MLVSEIKAIAAARTKGKWVWSKQGLICDTNDAEFIAMAANTFDKLLAVVEAAKELTGGWDYDHAGWEAPIEELAELQKTIAELEWGEGYRR